MRTHLANQAHDPLGGGGRHVGVDDARDIEPEPARRRLVALHGGGELAHRFLRGRVVVAGAASGEVGDLDRDIGRHRHHLVEKDAHLGGTVRTLAPDARAKMDGDRHPARVINAATAALKTCW